MARWRIVKKQWHFNICCERNGSHIQICYGSDQHNIPYYGTEKEAWADAETICNALNSRDDEK